MEQQPRGTEMPRGGIRNFMNDPKSSVMNYLAENMAAQHLQQQPQQQNHGANGLSEVNSSSGQENSNRISNGLSGQFLNPGNSSQTSLAQSQTGQSSGNVQSPSPQPGYSQSAQGTQITPTTPYAASNVASNGGRPSEAYAGTQSGPSQPQPEISKPHRSGQTQGSENLIMSLGKVPSATGMKRNTSPQSAPRLYHRMSLDFEVTKSAFFAARAQQNSLKMTSAAYDLESLSRRIWSLRFEHAWDFEGFLESGHQAVIANWQAQYELWADTVLDIQKGDSAASMFSVHGTPSFGSNSLNVTAPGSGTGVTDSYGQLQQPPYQNMSLSEQIQAPGPDQQVTEHQNLPMGHNMPIGQNAQISPPSQYVPPPVDIHGGYPSGGTPPSVGNSSQQSGPFQQQSMSLPFQQVGEGQNGPLALQSGPPSTVMLGQNGHPIGQNWQTNMGPGPQNSLNMQPIPRRNTKQESFQQTPQQQQTPQHMPPQQGIGQQVQGGQPPSIQHSPFMNQRPPLVAPSTSLSPPKQMPQLSQIYQMSQGQISSSRPSSNLPQSVQAGGG